MALAMDTAAVCRGVGMMGDWNTTATGTTTNDNLVPCKYCKGMILPTIAFCPGCGGEQT